MSFERAAELAERRKAKSLETQRARAEADARHEAYVKELAEKRRALEEIIDVIRRGAVAEGEIAFGENGPFFVMVRDGRFAVSLKGALTDDVDAVDADFAGDPRGGIFAGVEEGSLKAAVERVDEIARDGWAFDEMRWVVGPWNLSFNEALCYLEGEIDLPVPDEMYEGVVFDVQEEFRALFDEPSQMVDVTSPPVYVPSLTSGVRTGEPAGAIERVVTPEGEVGIFVPVGPSVEPVSDIDLPSGEAP